MACPVSVNPILRSGGAVNRTMGGGGEVMVLGFPQQGHMNPLMVIAGTLASQGFAVTFPLSPAFHHLLDTPTPPHHHDDAAGIRLERLPPQHGEDEEERADSSKKKPELRVGMGRRSIEEEIEEMKAMETAVDKLILVAEERHCHRPSFIIADFFVVWAHKLATKHRIPLLVFFTTNASSCYLAYHIRLFQSESILPLREEDGTWRRTQPVDCLPGQKPLQPKDFPTFLTLSETHPLPLCT